MKWKKMSALDYDCFVIVIKDGVMKWGGTDGEDGWGEGAVIRLSEIESTNWWSEVGMQDGLGGEEDVVQAEGEVVLQGGLKGYHRQWRFQM